MVPDFLTEEQWFTWLNHHDIHTVIDASNLEMQKQFITNLYFAEIEKNDKFYLSPAAVKILREVRTYVPGLRMPRFLNYIYAARPDLMQAFPINHVDTPLNMNQWYKDYGWKEYKSEISHDLIQGNEDNNKKLRNFPSTYNTMSVEPKEKIDISGMPFGVNLVGYAQGEFGIGEDIRTIAKCLQDSSIDFDVFNIPNGSNARQNDHSLDPHFTSSPRYPITILCTSPLEIPRLKMKFGNQIWKNKYVVAYSPWEIELFPELYKPALGWVDEIWAISNYVLNIYRNSTDTVSFLMPPAVCVGEKNNFAIKKNSELIRFLCSFDPNSKIERKNPEAAVRAFSEAFSRDCIDVELLILVNSDNEDMYTDFLAKNNFATDARIKVIYGTKEKEFYHRIMASSHCYVSPHRAEGFGRNIAEAKLLGVAVISTGYSGSLDFTNDNEQVAWEYTSIRPGDYPFSDGARWAEIDVAALAGKMRYIYERRGKVDSEELHSRYSVGQAGMRYKKRLLEIHRGE